MTQDSLFNELPEDPAAKPRQSSQKKQLLITVTTAPNPSTKYGETVCVAGIEIRNFSPTNWIRLYPINLRYLRKGGSGFKKYDIITAVCKKAKDDHRPESWNPDTSSFSIEKTLKAWDPRRPFVDPLATDTMCGLFKNIKENSDNRSLGLCKPADISDFRVEPHPGWTPEEQTKIDRYVNQMDLFETEDKLPLSAPRMKGSYRWRCQDTTCSGHEQQLLDWEFVALQRNLVDLSDTELQAVLREKFLDELCSPERDVAFYVGNQAKRHHTFSILGVYWPKRIT